MQKKIYIFGNPLLDFDSLPIRLKPALERAFPETVFIIQDPNENLHPENGGLTIIDTVIGPDRVVVIDDLEKIETSPSCSLHDLDLGFNLKLLKKIDRLRAVKIFGVPAGMEADTALEQLVRLMRQD